MWLRHCIGWTSERQNEDGKFLLNFSGGYIVGVPNGVWLLGGGGDRGEGKKKEWKLGSPGKGCVSN